MDTSKHSINERSTKYRFLIYDFFYLCITYSWVLLFPLSGEDFLIYQKFRNGLLEQLPLDILISPFSVRLTNFLLCYLIMVIVYFLTQEITKGLWWLGSLSAVVLMAHPLMNAEIFLPKVSSTLMELLLSVTCTYCVIKGQRHNFLLLLSIPIVLIVTYIFPYNSLIILCALILWLLNRNNLCSSSYVYALIFLVISGIGVVVWSEKFHFTLDIFPSFSLLVYPFGWLIESQRLYNSSLLYPVLLNILTLLFLGYITYLFKHSKPLHSLVIVTLILLYFPPKTDLELSYPLSNSHLLYPMVFLSISFAHICGIIQKFPKWNNPIIKATTLLCIVMIIFQFYLHFEKGYAIYMEGKTVEKLREYIRSSECEDIIIFPAKIVYRWSSIDIYSSLFFYDKYPGPVIRYHPVGMIKNPDNIHFSLFLKDMTKDPFTLVMASPDLAKIQVEHYQIPPTFETDLNSLHRLLIISNDGKKVIKIQPNRSTPNNLCVYMWHRKECELIEIKKL